MSSHRTADVGQWWRDLTSTAIVGTGRRPVPPRPELGVMIAEPGHRRPEEALLDAAALGGAALRAGRLPSAHPTPGQSPTDERGAAPRRATQLLELLLTHPPVGADEQRALLTHWMRSCDRASGRLPHALLPTVLDAVRGRELRAATVEVLDARGRWLAAQLPQWSWIAETPADVSTDVAADAMDVPTWSRLGREDRLAVLPRVRRRDPAAARTLVESTWPTDPVDVRVDHLLALRSGLSLDDEPLLERALDDRSARVRQMAADVLDGLPGSRRGVRMAARLAPLLQTKGLLRRGIEVTFPDEPDAAGVRDGLGRPPPKRSARGWWLERIVGGAPLHVWTDRYGGEPADVLRRVESGDVQLGLSRAARTRQDVRWADAILDHGWDPLLLFVLPPSDLVRRVPPRLAISTAYAEAMMLVRAVPAPWDATYSIAVVSALRASPAGPATAPLVRDHLVAALHEDAVPALESWLPHVADQSAAKALRAVLQFHSVKRSITEAFR